MTNTLQHSISRPIKAGTCTVAGGWSGFANYQIVGKVMTVAGKVTAGYELNVYASDRLIFLGQNVKGTMWFNFCGAGSGTWECKATDDSLYLTNNSQKQIWDANTAYVTFSFSVVLSQYSISPTQLSFTKHVSINGGSISAARSGNVVVLSFFCAIPGLPTNGNTVKLFSGLPEAFIATKGFIAAQYTNFVANFWIDTDGTVCITNKSECNDAYWVVGSLVYIAAEQHSISQSKVAIGTIGGGATYRMNNGVVVIVIKNSTLDGKVMRTLGNVPSNLCPNSVVYSTLSYSQYAGFVCVNVNGTVTAFAPYTGDYTGQVVYCVQLTVI